ncbi:M23 family metallopeptidase [candidate division KSB1 bacterium]|nr:M23 family metallopeptidase [candidate division KSB1 bacterium]
MKKFALIFVLFAVWLVGCHREKAIPPEEPTVSWMESRLSELERREGYFRYGETLDRVLSRELDDRHLIQEIIAAFAGVFDVRYLHAGKKYTLLADTAGVVQGFEYNPDKERLVRVLRDSTGVMQAQLYNKPLLVKIKSLHGVLYTTLYDAIKDCGETDELIVAFSDVFQWDIDFFTDPRVGDEFVMAYESVYVCDPTCADSVGDWVRYGRVLAGEYHSSENRYTAVYFQGKDKEGGYYDLEGNSFQKTFLRSPLNYRRISSHFSGARRHPIMKTVRPHTGIDFAAPAGTPVSAAADGIIIEKGYDTGIGNYLKIRHKNIHFVTLYGHLQAFVTGMDKGQTVKQRDIIGYVGSTGIATGPHLHYAFYENGRAINPLRIKNSSGDPIADVDRADYERVKEEMLLRLSAARSMSRERMYSLHFRNKYGVGVAGLRQPR